MCVYMCGSGDGVGGVEWGSSGVGVEWHGGGVAWIGVAWTCSSEVE